MSKRKQSTESVIRQLLVDTTVLTTKLESQLAFFDLGGKERMGRTAMGSTGVSGNSCYDPNTTRYSETSQDTPHEEDEGTYEQTDENQEEQVEEQGENQEQTEEQTEEQNTEQQDTQRDENAAGEMEDAQEGGEEQ
ncbi:uncharacterized protein MONOS_10643 [Monocercomonoides exilis]|uniref:uncharacterized protein n=1 Tax=Monocercomonoides exilis TaxID=2049356 RepID=UPI00355941BA|nr:hypothetical protein MONOS_10643 [Monocercomonoides exilis]|eukprot:MONOS_10643.1-p1 / transcript=MONOS_10643.1 / gene=MONOS_10643 / organism=Monocercomonoides_exilis_PA203 / gene_product=unspecified product / transcript_product=unspecified product / location=Mono_scaffold00492:8094-8717(-) / protein_length=136 / sequence_SO=supercontig / SO=protein_coding / is_pseudo=false